jgi:hypothetical protein
VGDGHRRDARQWKVAETSQGEPGSVDLARIVEDVGRDRIIR